MPTILDVNFFFWGGGGLKPWKNNSENFEENLAVRIR